MRVLLIDDDPEDLRLSVAGLREIGIDAEGSLSWEEARPCASSFDVVLVDLTLRPTGAEAVLAQLPPGVAGAAWSSAPRREALVGRWPLFSKPLELSEYEPLCDALRKLAGAPRPGVPNRNPQA